DVITEFLLDFACIIAAHHRDPFRFAFFTAFGLLHGLTRVFSYEVFSFAPQDLVEGDRSLLREAGGTVEPRSLQKMLVPLGCHQREPMTRIELVCCVLWKKV